MKRVLILALCLGPASAGAQSAAERAANTITPDDYLRRLGVIAHDSMQGRNTPSPGLDKTAAFIAGEFRAMGLEPGTRDGFIQRYPLRRTRLDLDASGVTVWGGERLTLAEHVTLIRGGATDAEGVSGPTVVVHGRPHDAADFDRLELEGAVVVALPEPAEVNTWRRLLAAQNPAAVLFVAPAAGRTWEFARRRQSGPSLDPGWSRPAQVPVLWIREDAVAPALAANGVDVAALRKGRGGLTARTVTGFNVTVHLAFEPLEDLTAPNVVGVLQGSDPLLADEYVVYSAHMDHVGVGRAVAGDSIYNGADDDASGTIAVAAIAEAFAALPEPPRRSVIFLLVSGEERGLWGSEYFAANPTVPIDRIVANLNADMVGRNWRDTIVVIGKEHSSLGTTLNMVNQHHPELNMTAIDDLWPAERFYFRSDHYNFARRGVPILFFFNGTHPDYHQPSDEIARIDGDKATRIAKLMFFLGHHVANADERPRWNRASYRRIVEGAGRD